MLLDASDLLIRIAATHAMARISQDGARWTSMSATLNAVSPVESFTSRAEA